MQAVSMTDGTKVPLDNLSPTPPQEPSPSLHQATLDGEHTGRAIPSPASRETLESGENGGKSSARLMGIAFAIVTCACLGLLLLYAYVATRVEAVGRLSELK